MITVGVSPEQRSTGTCRSIYLIKVQKEGMGGRSDNKQSKFHTFPLSSTYYSKVIN